MVRFKELEAENAKLKRIVADQVLEIATLKDITSKKIVTPEAKREDNPYRPRLSHLSFLLP